jgi:hypothetical protein
MVETCNCRPFSFDWPAVVFFVQSPDLYKKETAYRSHWKWMGWYSANCSSRKWKWDFVLYRKLCRERDRKRRSIDRGLTVLRSISKSLKLLFYPSLCILEWTLTLHSCILWYWSSSSLSSLTFGMFLQTLPYSHYGKAGFNDECAYTSCQQRVIKKINKKWLWAFNNLGFDSSDEWLDSTFK